MILGNKRVSLSDYEKDKMSKKTRYLLTIFLISVLCGSAARESSYLTEENFKTPYLSLKLTDNTKIKGRSSQSKLPLFILSRKIMIPLEQVSIIQFDINRENAIINFQNGDRLTTVLDVNDFEVETIFGKVKVNINQVKKIIVSNRSNIPEEGLVAYYPFNGNADDESGNGNNGIVYRATLINDRFGNGNSAYNFDGKDNYIRVPNNPNLNISPNGFTVGLWIKAKITQYSGERYYAVIDKSHGGIDLTGWVLQANIDNNSYCNGALNGLFTFFPGTTIDPCDKSTIACFPEKDVRDEKWHYITGTYDGQTAKIYFDGVLQNTTIVGNNLPSNTRDLFIGRWYRGRYFNGIIDDVRIYDYALSESEIQNLYNSVI
ncbi:MAG: LamG domain-containing protein [bacterium]